MSQGLAREAKLMGAKRENLFITSNQKDNMNPT